MRRSQIDILCSVLIADKKRKASEFWTPNQELLGGTNTLYMGPHTHTHRPGHTHGHIETPCIHIHVHTCTDTSHVPVDKDSNNQTCAHTSTQVAHFHMSSYFLHKFFTNSLSGWHHPPLRRLHIHKCLQEIEQNVRSKAKNSNGTVSDRGCPVPSSCFFGLDSCPWDHLADCIFLKRS